MDDVDGYSVEDINKMIKDSNWEHESKLVKNWVFANMQAAPTEMKMIIVRVLT
jgi:hypothetical protein